MATRELVRRFRQQHGLVTRDQLYACGVGRDAVRRRIATGEWQLLGRTVLRLAGAPNTPEQQLMALCLACGPAAVVSHQSAGWLWGMLGPPERHHVCLGRNMTARARLGAVHHVREWPIAVVNTRGFPCTSPARTLVDLARELPADALDSAVDQALAARVVALDGVRAELDRLARRGRHGLANLRRSLDWRQGAGSAQPSVLESMALRLLRSAGIVPVATEVVPHRDLGYRVDMLLCPGLALEVDGYSYHHSAEQMTEDARRRNRLNLAGTRVLVYTWRDIDYDGHRVVSEVRAAMSQLATA